MSRHQRTVHNPGSVAGLEQVGHDVRSATIPLVDHAHQGTEICYLARGEVTWMVGRKRLRLVGGCISVIGPGLVHKGEFDVIAPSDLYWVIFDAGQLLPELDPGTLRRLTGRKAWVAPAPGRIGELFANLMTECARKRAGWHAAVGASLSLLAVESARLSPRGGKRRDRTDELPGPVVRAVQIIAEDLEKPPTMRELARRVGLGPTRFHQLFKETIGLTPRDYVARVRLHRALAALAAGARDITALAFKLGFPSSQHFATVFKKHTGLTPSAFRSRAQKRRGCG